jgi:hypothetical protein
MPPLRARRAYEEGEAWAVHEKCAAAARPRGTALTPEQRSEVEEDERGEDEGEEACTY